MVLVGKSLSPSRNNPTITGDYIFINDLIAPVSEITTETTTTTTSIGTTTRNQQTTESLDTSSITAAITTTSQLPTITTSSETGTTVTPTETATNEQLQTESSGTSAPPPLLTITTETTSTEQFLTTSSGTSTPPTTTTTTTETVSTDRLPTISPGTSIPPTLLTTTIKEITSTEHLPTTSSTSRTPSQPISIEQYSTSPVTVNEVSSDQTKMDLDCLCSCEDLHEMSQQEFLEMLESLQIDKSKLSATRRKLTSAPDNRVESKSMGVFGIVVISIVVGLFILADLSSLLQAGSLSGGKLFKQS
ncbi:salivary glue protein Sgs-3-like [Mercenaria mercenaria]|uniref:salivary glue protein Sgs-3-like n=1 Tax=Mercenaria mercenaria TaxID=6596 RepID=UPI00234E8D4F|nr:salivary glue protein Sgs-3-like [Mercenaria mercenaria]